MIDLMATIKWEYFVITFTNGKNSYVIGDNERFYRGVWIAFYPYEPIRVGDTIGLDGVQ